MNLGEKIRYLREEKNLTQQQLADLMNINRVTLTGYEIGRRTPDIFTAKKLAGVFEVTLDYLLDEEL